MLKNKLNAFIFVVISLWTFTIVVQGPFLSGFWQKSLPKMSDAEYYLSGADSIFEFEIEQKFNDKRYPIIGQKRVIEKSDMPPLAKYLLAAYPNPSFKFGYSLVIAVLTSPFSDGFIEKTFSRVVWTNLILMALTLASVAAFSYLLTGQWASAWLSGAFVAVDPYLVHNSYQYGSHTLSGLFFTLLGLLVLLNFKPLKKRHFFAFGFLMSFSALCSSHHLFIAFFVGAAFFVVNLNSPYKKIQIVKQFGMAFVGAILPFLYILICETVGDFKKNGLPRFFSQFANYKTTVQELISTYPIFDRFLWDPRLFNIFFVPVFLGTLVFVYIAYRHSRGEKRRTQFSWKWFGPIAGLLLAFGLTAFYSQPLSRAAAPYTFSFNIIWGSILGLIYPYLKLRIKDFYIITVTAMVLLGALSLQLLVGVLKVSDPWPDRRIYTLDETDVVEENRQYFFTNLKIGTVPFKDISLPLDAFLADRRSLISGENMWLKFDGMMLVTNYASIRRFIPKFLPRPEWVLTEKVIDDDFKLIGDILDLIDRGLISQSAVVVRSHMAWPVELWDQEYHYIYGYVRKIKDFSSASKLSRIDPRKVYYFRIDDLKAAALNRGNWQ